jgi:hypothetical protein
MSVSRELQKFIYDTLRSDPVVVSHVSDRIYDAPPANARYPYISFGPSDATFLQDDCIDARTENFQVDVWSVYKGGKSECKAIVDSVVGATKGLSGEITVDEYPDPIPVHLSIFLARVFEGPDGILVRGVVSIQALIDG